MIDSHLDYIWESGGQTPESENIVYWSVILSWSSMNKAASSASTQTIAQVLSSGQSLYFSM